MDEQTRREQLKADVSREFKRLFRKAANRKRISEAELIRRLGEPLVNRERQLEAMEPAG